MNNEYYEGTTTDAWQKFGVGGASKFILSNDSLVNQLEYSYTLEGVRKGRLLPNETLEIDCNNPTQEISEIYVKDTVAGQFANFRLWAW